MTTYSASRLQGIGVFVQAVDAGSFTSAAQRIGLSKSAVGKSVAALEQRLGVRLFDRTTRRLALTAEGYDFYQTCLKVLNDLDEAESRAASQRQDVSGTLRINLPVTFGKKWVMPALCRLAQQHPKLLLDVTFSDRAVDLLEENIDLVVRLGELGNSASLSARHLGDQALVLCASPGYLAEWGHPTSAHNLANHRCLNFGHGGHVMPWLIIDQSGNISEVKVKGSHTISDGDALRSAALGGLGIAQLPTWLVTDDLKEGSLVPTLNRREVGGTPIHALWPATRSLAPKIRVTVDTLRDTFTPAPWDA